MIIQKHHLNDLDRLSTWSNVWKLDFKASKSKEVIFSPSRKPHEYGVLNLRQDALPRGDSHKHLGFILDKNPDFNEHLTNITVICNNLLNPSRQLNKSVRLERMHQEYGSIFFASANQNQLAKLDQITGLVC
jgi:hypothetical protein